jgi:phosphatidylglycerophosphate synthase
MRIYFSIPLHFVTFWFCLNKNYEAYPEAFSYLLLIYVALFASDGTDGIVARACGLVSDEGAILDAKADKITDVPLFWIFILTGVVGPTNSILLILVILVLLMTIADIIGQCCRGMSGHPAAKLIGKSKTVLKMLTIVYIAQYMKHADFYIIIWDIPVYIFSDYAAIGMIGVSAIFALLSMESKLPIEKWVDEKIFSKS